MKIKIVSQKNKNRRHRSFFVFIIILPILCTVLGSCSILLTHFDSTTYKNLTDLKAETATLVESFDIIPYLENKQAIYDVTLKFRKAYEYEKGKGKSNSDTIAQFEKIKNLLYDDFNDYRESGPGKLGTKYFQEAAATLEQAFDIVIGTENAKNKDTQ